MKGNPPIKGHGLMWEGHVMPVYGRDEMHTGAFTGGCWCGAKPPGWPRQSINAMKRWHRQHKAELRSEVTS